MIQDLLWLTLGLLVMLAAAVIAVPLMVLVWWAGWTERAESAPDAGSAMRRARAANDDAAVARAPGVTPTAGHFLVYFAGIDDISDVYQSHYENELLAAVAARTPGLVVITDVFGFSVNNLSMTSQRRLGWFWTWVHDVRLRRGSPLKLAGVLINLRNILHVSVSADRRYGPVYNYGVAEMALQSLLRHGYRLGSGDPVTLLGFSGGAQIALAAAGTVQRTLGAPVQVITMGGMMNASASLADITRLTLLYGTRDYLQWLPDWVFPARWPFPADSAWNRARRTGKLRRICLGPMEHTKRNSYLDGTVYLPDGRSYRDATADAIAELLTAE